MQILFLILIAYLFLPVIGELYLILSGERIASGDVSWDLFVQNLMFSSLVLFIIYFGFYLFNIKRNKELGFTSDHKDKRTLFRISIIMTIIFILVFIFSGYDYLIKGQSRGDIRVGLGLLGFFYKWLIGYATPLLIFITSVIYIRNIKSANKSLILYIYILAAISSIFTGYKYVVVFTFLPAFFIYFYNKNIIKSVIYIVPIVLLFLIFTTKMVMSFDTYARAFDFLIHRMTVMSAYGTVGVYNYYPNGADFNEWIKTSYSMFGNKINSFIFGIDFNSFDALDANLARKITFMVYPAWETALSGTANLTVTNFGEAIFILGRYNFLYAIFAGLFVLFIFNKLVFHVSHGNLIKSALFLVYILSVILSWFNSSSIFTLFSLPVILYMCMSYIFLILILRAKIT